MQGTSFSQYLNRLVSQIDTEQSGLIRRLRIFQADWLPASTFYPSDDQGLELRPSSAARKLHDDGTDSVFLPFTLRSPDSLDKILADAEIVAKWQAGVCSFTRMILPIMERVDAQFARYSEHIRHSQSEMLIANVQHIGVAYKAIKHELNEAIQKFSVCRDEFLVSLKVDEDRTTAKEALRFLYGKIEDWFARLEELSRFCRTESTTVHFADLLAPKTNTLIETLGVRITQWEENGSFLVKLENVGNNRIELAEALFTMPETEVRNNKSPQAGGNRQQQQRQKQQQQQALDRSDENDNTSTSAAAASSASSSTPVTTTSAKTPQTPTRTEPRMPLDWTEEDPRKWVDMVKINRILTPYPVRVQNLRRKIVDEVERASFHPEPSFICFSFARNTIRSDSADDAADDDNNNADDNNDDNTDDNARSNDRMGFGDQYRGTDENAMESGPGRGLADADDNTEMSVTNQPAVPAKRSTKSGGGAEPSSAANKSAAQRSADVLRSCMSTSFKIKLLPSQ